ncbi:iron complex outermembrane receptor protein [Rhodoblastus acidophilus]|uniref:TonB-dependent receptor family protein n=1 Tax=Rhodoblastus acidophilus TaxID=1074 RepID=UPI0022246D86|nr:TonB-dependent receptor [Rhodoblastus acidophilus]MCW2318660.1 iron complex outermembrane receptor protein [Rhodoblastus acidophilus]
MESTLSNDAISSTSYLKSAFGGALTLSVVFAFPGWAFAAEGEPYHVETVEIRGTSDTDIDKEKTRAIPGAAELISSDDIKKNNNTTVTSILQDQPGVLLGATGGNTGVKLTVRGSGLGFTPGYFQNGVKILFNGLPLSGPAGNTFELLEPLAVNRTQVLKGANGVEYGALALGGAVNFVEETGRTSPGTTLNAGVGSFGLLKGGISQGGVYDNVDYYISVSGQRETGFQDQTQSNSKTVTANIGYQLTPDLYTQFFVKAAQEYHYAAAPISLAQIRSDPTQTSAAYAAMKMNVIRDGSVWLGSKTTYNIDNVSGVEFGLTFNRFPLRMNDKSTVPSESNYQDVAISLRYHNASQLAGHENMLTLASYYTYEVLGTTRAYTWTATQRRLDKINDFAGSYDWVNTLGNDFAVSDKLHITADLSGINVNRNAIVEYSRTVNTSSYPTAVHYNDWDVAPRLGATYQATKDVQIFANVSRSVDPATTQFYSPSTNRVNLNFVTPLKNQRATTGEVGTRYSDDAIEGSLTYFYSAVQGELLPVVLAPATSTTSMVIGVFNASATIHQGVEAAAKLPVLQLQNGDKLELRPVFTYNDFHFRNDSEFGKNKLPLVPDYFYSASLDYTFHDGYYAGVNVRGSASSYADYANTLKAPAYALLGLKLGYIDPKNQWAINLDLDNITNAKYVNTLTPTYNANHADGNYFYPGDGFGVFLRTTVKL